MPLSLDPRNAIPVLESVPNLQVSEIFKRLTTSALVTLVDLLLLFKTPISAWALM